MTTPAKADANRRNALQSTGPRSPGGKAISSQNARRHGLLAREVVLADEDQEAFQSLQERLKSDLAPVGELEALLVERIAATAWRLRRVLRIETSAIHGAMLADEEHSARRIADQFVRQNSLDLAPLTTTITDEKAHQAAVRAADEARLRRYGKGTTLGRAFCRDQEDQGTDPLGLGAREE